MQLMDEWGIDGVVNLSGMYPGPPHQRWRSSSRPPRAPGGRIAVFTTPDFRLVRARQGLRRGAGGPAVRSQAAGRHRPQDHQGPGPRHPRRPTGSACSPIDDRGLDPLFAAGRRAGHAGRDPHRRSEGVLAPPTPDNERWDELRVHPEWSFSSEPRRPRPGRSSTTRSSAWSRATRRRRSSASTSATIPRIPPTSRACWTATPTSSSTPPRASPRSAATRRDKMRRFFVKYQDRILFGTDTGIGAEPEDMMYGSTGAERADARRRGPLLHLDAGATSRPPTASSRARRRSRAAGRSTASACPTRCCARSTSKTPPAPALATAGTSPN